MRRHKRAEKQARYTIMHMPRSFSRGRQKSALRNMQGGSVRRQCGPVVRVLALRSGDPGFKTRSDHSLNLFLVVRGSTSQLHL